MNNTIFYLIGHSPAARLAIAEAIATRTGARVIDSQAIYAPIFGLIDHANPATLPDIAWQQIDAVRGAMLKTIETVSPRDWSFVFTHAGFDIPADVGVYRTVRETARKRGARFVPVTLTGGPSKKALLTFEEADVLRVAAEPPRAAVDTIIASVKSG